MRKLALILFVSFIVIGSAYAAVKNSFKGTWDYQVPDAPYEYSTGKIVFAEAANGQPTITIKFTNGTEVSGKEVKIENDSFSFKTEVDYNAVKVNGKLVEGKISAKIDTPQGLMNMTAVQKR
jgi:hypothetical protein